MSVANREREKKDERQGASAKKSKVGTSQLLFSRPGMNPGS